MSKLPKKIFSTGNKKVIYEVENKKNFIASLKFSYYIKQVVEK